jgi:nucleoside-diphosphate-sugar epimerase
VTKEKEKVLVTGVGGYLGSHVARKLMESGYEVMGLDSLIYDNANVISSLAQKSGFTFRKADIHDWSSLETLLQEEKFSAIVHLAALVGDATCSMNPLTATRTNYEDTAALAKLIAKSGNGPLIFASSASVYGKDVNGPIDESSQVKPLSLYAWTKVLSEKAIEEVANLHKGGFEYTILRFATAYGLSERMRFDLVVNSFVLQATQRGKIVVFGGAQARPFVGASDIADAVVLAVKRREETKGKILNVGSDEQNRTINELALMVQRTVPNTTMETIGEITDERSYRVSFAKLRALGFRPSQDLESSIHGIHEAIVDGTYGDAQDRRYYNNPLLN